MSRNQKYPRLECHGFLERAFAWLKSGQDIELFYAALELRFTFEKLLVKHANASTYNSPDFLLLHWQPTRLHNHLLTEFGSRLDLRKPYRFMLDLNNDTSTMGYFLPIPDDLFNSYGRLNDYLHAQWAIKMFSPTQDWYKETYEFLFDFANTLIPHASPDNSLGYYNIPNIQFKEIELLQLKQILQATLPAIQG